MSWGFEKMPWRSATSGKFDNTVAHFQICLACSKLILNGIFCLNKGVTLWWNPHLRNINWNFLHIVNGHQPKPSVFWQGSSSTNVCWVCCQNSDFATASANYSWPSCPHPQGMSVAIFLRDIIQTPPSTTTCFGETRSCCLHVCAAQCACRAAGKNVWNS